MPYTHIAFDIDGTLINSEYANMKSLQDTLTHFTGSAPTLEELSSIFGLTGRDTLKRLGIRDVDTTLDYWVDRLYDYMDTVTVYPGILDLLDELKGRGVSIGIISSQTRDEYAHGVALTPLAAYFPTLILSDDTTQHKPHPDPMLKFLERTGCAPAQALYVGDREGDMRCAHGAGVAFALARWGNPRAQMPADHDLKTPADLLNIL